VPTAVKSQKSRIYSPQEYDRIKHLIPKSLLKAAGLWRNQRIDPIAYQRKIRQQWERRLKILESQ
jgi:hypothetical protein